jgi:diguanylate cyclase (GGDEF)-like protein
MLVRTHRQPVPSRALAISLAALVVPVAAAFWLPEWTGNSFGMLVWLSALIPAFLLSYYRGLAGVALALVGGMAVITATQVSVVAFNIADPNWVLLGAIVGVYLAVSMGIAGLSEVLRRERLAAEEMALIDRLTGLPNRRHADITLEREFAAAERGGRDLTVVLFDLDRFKGVNDKYGHAAGDLALKTFAKILAANTRKENLSARFGGEEFVSILREANADAALVFANRVLDQTRDRPFPWGKQTVSAGVGCYEDGMGTYELLLTAADRALYEAKDTGRDRICVAPQHAPRVAPTGRRPPRAVTPSATPAPPPPAPARPAGARIYVVDDDNAVRSVIKRMLATGGYQIWDTDDPLAAIQRFSEAGPEERPDLILTDMIMPKMTGMRMIDQIAQISPTVKVIYMSGYVQSEIKWSGTPGSVVAFLEKPIDMATQLTAVSSVIGQAAPT